MLSNLINGIIAVAGGHSTTDANDAPTHSPTLDLPPLPLSRDSPPASRSTPTVIDLSSPTKPSRKFQRDEQPSGKSLPRSSKRAISEDERRLVGDYEIPADAVSIPNPSSWMSDQRTMHSKPGANKGYRPVDTLNGVARAVIRKPTTYGKHARPRSGLIGQSPGPGQIAYSEFQRSKTPTTPSRHGLSRGKEDQWSGGPASAKRRKIEHVINLDEEEDEDDEAMVVTRSEASTPRRPSDERPISAMSSQSRLNIGSGSTGAEFKIHRATNEFREVDGLMNPGKKPRQASCNKRQARQNHSPVRRDTLSGEAHQFIIRSLKQGEPPQKSVERQVASKHFPEARINESTTEQPSTNHSFTSNSANLRTQHRPVPKQLDQMEESDSADELAISPVATRKQTLSPSKVKKAVQSGAKRNGHSKTSGDSWPLSFARSYGFEGAGSKMEDGHDTLVLRSDPKGLRLQKYSTEGYETIILIHSQEVNKVHADETSRVRLEGPRNANGNIPIFDLEFLNSNDFLAFCNSHAASLTTSGKILSKDNEHMRRLFAAPLRARNDKVAISEISDNAVNDPKSHDTHSEQAERPLGVQEQRHERGVEDRSTLNTTKTATTLSRSSRSRPLASTRLGRDSPDIVEVPKYSIDKGLGRPWTKSLEYGEGRQRAIVHFDDLPRLDEEEYLNDSLIDFYMIYLFKKLNVSADKVYFFNTYFFTKLTDNAGRKSMNYKAVERWTSKIDIFTYDYIVVPINESQSHWYLAIICNVSNIQRKPIVEDFDDPQLHIQETPELPTISATASDGEERKRLQPGSNPNSPAKIEEVHRQQDEDPNLFDEATISLIDRNDPGSRVRPRTGVDKSNAVNLESETEHMETPQTASDLEALSRRKLVQSSLSFAKNKNKRKAVPKRDPTQPVVVVLDSLGGIARSGAVRTLKDWIAAEGKSKRGMEAVIKENGYYPKGSQIPMQNNWTDCGVYLLGYIEKFFQNPDEFMHKLLTGSMSAEEDWPELNPSTMRHKMREIIFECHKQQEEARAAQKKAKKGSMQSKVSPDPASKQATQETACEKSLGPMTEAKSDKHATGGDDLPRAELSPTLPLPRLGSPFEPEKDSSASVKHSSQGGAAKDPDSSPTTKSPAKPGFASHSKVSPRRYSPEVRINNRTVQPHNSVDDTHSSPDRLTSHTRHIDQKDQESRSFSLSKRQRQDNHNHPTGSPNAKRPQMDPSLRKKRDGNSGTKAQSSRSGEGSAPDVPIEIKDSQEMEIAGRGLCPPLQPRASACHIPSSRPPRPIQMLQPSPSFEEIPRLPPRSKIVELRKKGASTGGQADDDYERDHARRSRAPGPSQPSQNFQRGEEGTKDPVEAISQSTDQMQLDGTQDSIIVRETPEPARSPIIT
ncbi:hypothetical protein COCMIDRAFT_91958 [Bipolaris oryzae ATCC 44560]|uniref:Ubiquitin-like protease family profile domain-containing protein n=1 Tax=Bipolaris oryzae ATCC 44560 TaxID=930090 RepID=W6ZSV2_COCMI|nr:uncharacterized protein COCMIDRAFT_91958 [Bipolaris oryzae ATCC 44560]EUC46741.1 hypothetical protein COCMIDRAFT_91958 [Bipolaris oryzae ATCC 44560]